MRQEDVERTTVANAIAIERLTVVVERTSKDVDKVVKHLDEMLPFKAELDGVSKDVDELKASRTRWAWSAFGILGTIIGTLIYVIKDLLHLGILGTN